MTWKCLGVRRLVTWKRHLFQQEALGVLMGCVWWGLLGTDLLADQIEQRAEAVGLGLHVPIFDLNVFEQMVAEAERLRNSHRAQV